MSVISFRLWPAEKTLPSALMTTIRLLGLSACSAISALMVLMRSSESAFLVLGEASVRLWTPSGLREDLRAVGARGEVHRPRRKSKFREYACMLE